MAAEMKAQLTLKLKDELSPGIQALEKRLERLANLFAKLNRLRSLGEALRVGQFTGDMKGAERAVDSFTGKVDAATRALQRLGRQRINFDPGGMAQLPQALSRGWMAPAVAAAIAYGSAGGAGRLPPRPDASFFGGPQLLLSGPGGIPLSPGTLPVPARDDAQWREKQKQLARDQLGIAGHRALAASATGYGMLHFANSAAELDAKLRQIAIIDGKRGAAVGPEVSRLRNLLGEDSTQTGQNVVGLAEAYRDLASRGMSSDLVDKLIGIHSRAATAYDVNPSDMGQAVYALNKTLGIGHGEMEGALAAMMQGTHFGSFNMTALSRYLPQVAGSMKKLGWTGRNSLDSVVSMLEVVSQQSGTPEETATNFKDMMQTLTAKYTVKSFKHVGIDLPSEMMAARRAGKNPVDAQLDIMERMVQGISDPMAQAYKLNDVMHNMQASNAITALLQNRKEQRERAASLHEIGADKLFADFDTAMAGLQPKLRRLSAEWKMFEIRLGYGFAPLVDPAIAALHQINGALGWLDERLPGLTGTVLKWGGGLLLVATGLGVLMPLFKAARVGLLLMGAPFAAMIGIIRSVAGAFALMQIAGGPILWIIEALALAAILIYENWDKIGPYFHQAWAAVKSKFIEFYAWAEQWISNLMPILVGNLKAAWEGLKGWFANLWADITAPFERFMTRVREAIAELRRIVGGGSAEQDGHPNQGDGRRDRDGPSDTQRLIEDLRNAPAMSMSYHPRGSDGFRYPPLDINVRVDGPARVDAPRQIQPDRGPMTTRT